VSEQFLKDETRPSSPHVDAGDAGYSKSLKSRHVNMIAIGGAIGTGLFLGAGGRLADAGPSLFIAYAVCGVFAFLVVRALGELVLYRPSSGAFVSYAREFMGEKGAYTAGWMYFLNWATTGIADITAVATYTGSSVVGVCCTASVTITAAPRMPARSSSVERAMRMLRVARAVLRR